MAFEQAISRTPTSIGRITITLTDDPQWANGTAEYRLQILDQDGEEIHLPFAQGNLAPHLTGPEINQLVAFMATVRARAFAQIIPQ